jgi:hypothetical protein
VHRVVGSELRGIHAVVVQPLFATAALGALLSLHREKILAVGSHQWAVHRLSIAVKIIGLYLAAGLWFSWFTTQRLTRKHPRRVCNRNVSLLPS